MNHVAWKMTRYQTRNLRSTFISIPSIARGVEEDITDCIGGLAGDIQADFSEGTEEETAPKI